MADPDLRILVLEAGLTTQNDPAHRYAARSIWHIAPGSRTVREHASRPSAALGGRSVPVHAGQCLGGGGSINCAFSPCFPPLPPYILSPFFLELERKERKANAGAWVNEYTSFALY